MKIFNEDYQYKTRFYKFLYIVIVAILVGLLYATNFLDTIIQGKDKNYILLFIVVIYLIINIIRFKRKYLYFYFDDETPSLVFRFFHLVFFNSNRLEFNIPKRAFYDFRIEKNFFGLREDLILVQKKDNKTYTYPAISMSAIPKRDKENLIKLLSALKINK